MKLEILDYIDEAADLLQAQREVYRKGAKTAIAYFDSFFKNGEDTTNISYRIKTSDSLREKILRNDLYKYYTPEQLFDNMSDIVGIRIGCRFLSDEKVVWERIKKEFTVSEDGEYFHPDGVDYLFLKADSEQPENQRNGFEIYRIDGCVVVDGQRLRFELQIKSLVNNFWSEIEHRIIYKNKRYMLRENFLGELMNSIYNNLVNVDKQLNMLYSRSVEGSNAEFEAQTETMLSAIVNELFSELVEDKTGVSVNFNEYAESLVKYIISGSTLLKSLSTEINMHGIQRAEAVTRVIERTREIDFDAMAIGEKIDFEFDFNTEFENHLEKRVAKRLYEAMNADFHINSFFHILFGLERGNDKEDFISFVRYYTERLTSEAKVNQKELISRVNLTDVSELLFESTVKKITS